MSKEICMLMTFVGVALVVVFLTRLVWLNNEIKKVKSKLAVSDDFTKEELMTFNEIEHDIFDENKAIKQLISPEGYDPSGDSYQILYDAGKQIFVRTFTISMLPKKMRFANSWSSIANFNGATSSVYIRPISKRESEDQLDKHVIELETEITRADNPDTGNINRSRKLRRQRRETEKMAEKVENSEDVLFRVGFLITIKSDSLSNLNLMSDELRKRAEKKDVKISGCYGVQKEAFFSNLPLNETKKTYINDVIHWFTLNRDAVTCLYNHTNERFVHKNGVLIGRGLNNSYPVMWDPYDKSHVNGYVVCINGPMGVGKSALSKSAINALIPFGYKFIAIDSQGVNGKGEYTDTALANNGIRYDVSNKSKVKINMFDLEPEIELVGGKEVKTINLPKKIDFLILTISIMLQLEQADYDTKIYIKKILRSAISASYAEIGIVDGDVNSLYVKVKDTTGMYIGNEYKKKEMPTLSDCYKHILIDKRNETSKNDDKIKAYDIALAGLDRYIEGIYYTEKNLDFLSKEEYMALDSEIVNKKKRRYVVGENGEKECVNAVEGFSTFFDGQSSIDASKDTPFITFDISSQSQNEKNISRSVLMTYIEEFFVKPNNEIIENAEKLIVVIDEAKEQFNLGEESRIQCDLMSSTCRKKNVGLWWISQACSDYDIDKHTRNIFKLADVKFIFKQSRMDEPYLKTLPLSENQIEKIYNLNGIKKENSNSFTRPGQVCLIDADTVYFLQTELSEQDKQIVETDARKIKTKNGRDERFWKEEILV